HVSAVHRSLHSFPKRRSSDLTGTRKPLKDSGLVGSAEAQSIRVIKADNRLLANLHPIPGNSRDRSVESRSLVFRRYRTKRTKLQRQKRTSELQSLTNLVCRLL